MHDEYITSHARFKHHNCHNVTALIKKTQMMRNLNNDKKNKMCIFKNTNTHHEIRQKTIY